MANIQTLKGFRDFLPEEARRRQYVLGTLKKVFALYGFEPLETPSLEYEDILTGKYGDEGDKLMYKFKDLGGRNVAMRYDQTVPLARVIAQRQNDVQLPFKRYQMQNVWRAENTQKGRYREFLQVDADIVGTYSPLADAEIIALAAKCLENLGIKDFYVYINDRKIFSDIPKEAILILDKLKKIGPSKVQEELSKRNFDPDLLIKLKNIPPSKTLITIKETLKKIDNDLTDERVKIENTLARGLDYYTGLIFEIEIMEYAAGSIAGGGRYDNLIGIFAGKEIPAVGFAFGFDRLIEAMDELSLFPKDINGKNIFIAFSNSNLQEKALNITSQLRNKGLGAEFYLEDATLEKQLKYADKKNIPFVVIVEDNNLILKDMEKRSQENLPLEKIIEKLS